ncbi:hypothetical protein BKA63DRAFT_24996 [Paraphoma chrysanthemicola]|nr:hypothetical protein BKA63DRAFT_24996 [Paraphoma chrysanthemicola]
MSRVTLSSPDCEWARTTPSKDGIGRHLDYCEIGSEDNGGEQQRYCAIRRGSCVAHFVLRWSQSVIKVQGYTSQASGDSESLTCQTQDHDRDILPSSGSEHAARQLDMLCALHLLLIRWHAMLRERTSFPVSVRHSPVLLATCPPSPDERGSVGRPAGGAQGGQLGRRVGGLASLRLQSGGSYKANCVGKLTCSGLTPDDGHWGPLDMRRVRRVSKIKSPAYEQTQTGIGCYFVKQTMPSRRRLFSFFTRLDIYR